MALNKEQLTLIRDAVDSVGSVISADDVRFAWSVLSIVDAELYRVANGPFTLAEARASGKPFKRPSWTDYAIALVDSSEEGYMCFVFLNNGHEPAYADELFAADYELLQSGDK